MSKYHKKKEAFGDLQVHCAFSVGCKCDYALVKDDTCIYNYDDDMVCTNQDVFNDLVTRAHKNKDL